MEQNIYMTTGELAKLMGITKETLFHYDEINLFCPALVTENGYRYYTVNQIELLDTILLLRELGMPLKEIRELLGSRSPEKMIEVFSAREERIRKEMTKLKNMKRWIARHKEKIETGLTVSSDEIRIQKFPERYYLYSMIEGNDEGEFYKKANAMVTKFLEKVIMRLLIFSMERMWNMGFMISMIIRLYCWKSGHRSLPIKSFQRELI